MSTNTKDDLNSNELFIEELNHVTGGTSLSDPPATSMSMGEESGSGAADVVTSRCIGEESGGGLGNPPVTTLATTGGESGGGYNTGITGGMPNLNNHVPPPVLR